MARPLRLQYPGAIYHLTSRGNAQQRIFWENPERQGFLDILAGVVARYRWLCHAYCLMDNHYHLLIETPVPNLAIGMRQLNGLYTQAFNRAHCRQGHLFQGRYKAILVQREAHLLELCRYIVLNPWRTNDSQRVGDWRWTSYPATAGLAPVPEFLTVDWILAQFGLTRSQAQAHYRAFVRAGVEDRPWDGLRGQIFLGDEGFIQAHTAETRDLREVPRPQWQALRTPLAVIFGEHRDRGIAVAYREHGYRLGEIAAFLGCHYSSVSRRLRALEARPARLQDLTPP